MAIHLEPLAPTAPGTLPGATPEQQAVLPVKRRRSPLRRALIIVVSSGLLSFATNRAMRRMRRRSSPIFIDRRTIIITLPFSGISFIPPARRLRLPVGRLLLSRTARRGRAEKHATVSKEAGRGRA